MRRSREIRSRNPETGSVYAKKGDSKFEWWMKASRSVVNFRRVVDEWRRRVDVSKTSGRMRG